MKLPITLAALAATALVATAADAAVVLGSDLTYDSQQTDPDQRARRAGTTGSGNNPFKVINDVPATGTAVGGGGTIDLTSVAPGNAGFTVNTSAGSIAVDGVITSSDNLGTLDPALNGFSTTFTPASTSTLGLLEVSAGKVNNSGAPAAGTAELTAIISQAGVDSTQTVITGGTGNFVSYSLDFTGTTLLGGSPVTLTIAQANSSNGNFASFDSFTLNDVEVIPEPASLGLLGLGGLALLRRRR